MKHPYVGLPDHQFWNNEAGIRDGARLDPVVSPAFTLTRSDRIVTAGSCFAQHVGRYLGATGFNYLVTEAAHPIIPPATASAHHYGQFSARYGNVYTARQLLQLIDRAYGQFTPLQQSWSGREAGSVVDPFRPQIQPGGYVSEAELAADREQHLAAVRQAFEGMHVFVFTLGLTEAWEDLRDGAVFPLAPGVAGGTWDTDTTAFRNFDESQTSQDLLAALKQLRRINPLVRIILTVSPVPLNATYESRHVLVSTTWSKAVLRVVADKVARQLPNCDYFPSYEIITSPHVRGRYFGEDCREILPEGVEHVMRVFLKHYAGIEQPTMEEPEAPAAAVTDDPHSARMQAIVEALCDEAAIDNR